MIKTWLVAKREFLESLKTKSFWLGILAMPILMVLSIGVPALLSDRKDVRRYAILDESGWLEASIEESADGPDLLRVLKELRRRQVEKDGIDELPIVLSKLSETLATVDEEHLVMLSNQLSALSGPDAGKLKAALPPQAQQAVMALNKEFRKWWRTLPADEADALGGDLDRSRYEKVPLPDVDGGDVREALNQMVESGQLFGYFVIPEVPEDKEAELRYVSNNLTDVGLKRWITRYANDVIQRRRFLDEGVDEQQIRRILSAVSFVQSRVGSDGDEEQVENKDRAMDWAPVVFVYLLWLAVYIIAQSLLTNTIEEKSNRIIEVLLSSVSPLQLMSGKIFGIALSGLLMVGSWVVFFFLAIRYLPEMLGASPGFDLTTLISDPVYLTSFVVYFLLGYLLYSAIFVAIGSVTNSLKEAQNMLMPMFLVLMVPLFAMIPVAEDPNGALAKFLSYIPIYTPFIMMNRAAAPPTTAEYVVTTLLLVVSVIAAFWVAGKVFRVGVLMTGKPPRIREIFRWLRA